MNCKPGDLAVIVAASRKIDEQHVGKIVKVVDWDVGAWVTDPELPCGCPCGGVVQWFDWELRPIRDSDGEDEMLRIVGKPQKVTA